MCNGCSSGQTDYGHGVRVGQERESNDRDPNRAANDPYYGGRSSYDSGRSSDYVKGVGQGRENVRNSTK
jgi:hypothetical protein